LKRKATGTVARQQMDKSFLVLRAQVGRRRAQKEGFKKEQHFFFEKKKQKTFNT